MNRSLLRSFEESPPRRRYFSREFGVRGLVIALDFPRPIECQSASLRERVSRLSDAMGLGKKRVDREKEGLEPWYAIPGHTSFR